MCTSSLLVASARTSRSSNTTVQRRLDPQVHPVAVLHAVAARRLRSSCARAARRESRLPSARRRPSGPTSTQPGVPSMLPLARTGSIDAERDAVGEREFHLAEGPRRAEDAHRRQHPPPRADDHHGLCGGVEAVLIEVLLGRQLVRRGRTGFRRARRSDAVPRRDADDQLRLVRSRLRRRRPICLQHDLRGRSVRSAARSSVVAMLMRVDRS